MATDLCVQYSVGSTLKMNEGGIGATTNTIRPSQITGLDGRPIRATILPNGASDGGDKLTARFGPRLIRVAGDIIVFDGGVPLTPVENITDYLDAVNDLVNAWISGLEGLLNTTFTLSWTATGQGSSSLTCTYGFDGGEFQSTPSPDMSGPTTVTFGLVCETG